MTKYTDEEDNRFNSFISSCVQQLKKGDPCYVYTQEHIEIIKKAMLKKTKKDIIVEQNECGYTLKIKKEVNKNE